MHAHGGASSRSVGGDFPHVEGVEHRFVEVGAADGPLRLHLAEAGNGDPVLLLHGWPQHWFVWRKLVPLLAPRLRLLMPDLRGFGWSEAPGRGYDPGTFTADAVALLDALEIERADLIGHDWGGFSALLAGIDHPGRFPRVLALNTPVPWARPSLQLLGQVPRLWYVGLMASPGLGPWVLRSQVERVARALRSDLVHGDAITLQEARVFADRLRSPDRSRATQLLYRSYLRSLDPREARAYDDRRMAIPTRLLFGLRDRFIDPALAHGGEQRGVELEYVPDSGHFIADEKPELVAERARELFDRPLAPAG
jgi:pimeloyl-ACP methyl ester carboxylesterase